MSAAQSAHNTAQSAAGYLYQARLALAEALRYAYVDSGVEIAVERLDDVSFEKNSSPLELLQTKHHLNKTGDLTDASVDLWKTLRVWSEAAKSDPSLPSRTRFALITTALAPEYSAASYLTTFDWLFVRLLWVAEPYRRQGIGSRLIKDAEAAARERNCRGAYVDTFTFPSPEILRAARLSRVCPGSAIVMVTMSVRSLVVDARDVIRGR